LQADLDRPESLGLLPTSNNRILYLAPPPESGQTDSRMHNFCEELTRRLPQLPTGIVYVSTSGVYGDCAGELVDESRPVNPQTDRARRRLDAETALQQWGALYRVPIVILRVAGIYGPGRLPLQRLQAGMPVLRPEQSPFSNRIHADDLARVCLAALDRVAAQGVFNVCDGEQSRMTDYFLAVARAFNLPEPEQVDRQEAQQRFSPEMLSYLAESRRLDNRRLLESLSIKLLYPTLESGLRSLFEPLTTGAQED
jgi:nucleoside-diphosphate-sugar epimerase